MELLGKKIINWGKVEKVTAQEEANSFPIPPYFTHVWLLSLFFWLYSRTGFGQDQLEHDKREIRPFIIKFAWRYETRYSGRRKYILVINTILFLQAMSD